MGRRNKNPNFAEKAYDGISNVFDEIEEDFEHAGASIKSTASGALNSASNVLSSATETVGSGLSSITSSIGSGIHSVVDGAESMFLIAALGIGFLLWYNKDEVSSAAKVVYSDAKSAAKEGIKAAPLLLV